ncbi:MAG: hypothetical protein ACRDCG_00280 [Mycoplasmoidaceae bacterium]
MDDKTTENYHKPILNWSRMNRLCGWAITSLVCSSLSILSNFVIMFIGIILIAHTKNDDPDHDKIHLFLGYNIVFIVVLLFLFIIQIISTFFIIIYVWSDDYKNYLNKDISIYRILVIIGFFIPFVAGISALVLLDKVKKEDHKNNTR